MDSMGPSAQSAGMSFACDPGELARQRADSAADRVRVLREMLNAADVRRVEGSTEQDLGLARRRADDARERLVTALQRSADAHDRAARAAARAGHAQRADFHRMAAEADRIRAAQVRSSK